MAEAVCTGTITREQYARLNALLPADEEAALCYVTYLRMHGLLLWRWRDQIVIHTGEAAQPAAAVPLGLLGQTWQGGVGFFSQVIPFSYLMATVITAAGLFGMWLWKVSDHTPQFAHSPAPSAPTAHEPEMASVGRITGMADCRWSDPRTAPAGSTAPVPLGRKYVLDSGLLEITYESGAKVILEGPCTYEVESSRSGFLSLGRLTARVEKSEIRNPKSEGSDPSSFIPHPSSLFSVRTPTATVTDLGTEFGVEVDESGRTESHVFVGAVQIALVGAKGEPDQTATLQAGEAARCGRSDGIVRSASPTNAARFVRSLQPAPVPTARIVEKFDGERLGAAFEQMPPGRYRIGHGAAEHQHQEPPARDWQQSRGYIRTIAADFCRRDFLFEATFQVELRPSETLTERHQVFFGMGDGVPNAGYCDEVSCGLVLAFVADNGRVYVKSCHPDALFSRASADPDADNKIVAHLAPFRGLGPGRHRFRMWKTGKWVRFAVDADFQGEFRADFASRPIELPATAPLLNATNSRLLVGTGNCDTMTVRFEELSVGYTETANGQAAPPRPPETKGPAEKPKGGEVKGP